MAELFNAPGIILKSEPVNEYDRRVVILTGNTGKISAFANGARRQGNRFQACTDLFVFADFKLYAGRSAYTISEASVKNYFGEFREDFDASLYGMYFLEVSDYITRENNDEKEMLILLYQALRALIHPAYDKRLVKCVFEIKAIMLQGEFDPGRYEDRDKTIRYTINFIMNTESKSLFSFTLKEEAIKELALIAKNECQRVWDGYKFKSEDMLEMLL